MISKRLRQYIDATFAGDAVRDEKRETAEAVLSLFDPLGSAIELLTRALDSLRKGRDVEARLAKVVDATINAIERNLGSRGEASSRDVLATVLLENLLNAFDL